VHPDFPAGDAEQFLTELKNNPDKYTYGSDGVGAFVQFSTARIFAVMAQAQTLLWRALIVPREVPEGRFDRLREAFTRAARSAEFKAMAEKRGEEVWDIGAADAARYAQAESAQMEQLARELRLKQD
jgi:tripartite-type tricarboxylate transporter receptor subunit TctC